MDWTAFALSLKLSFWTLALLLPVSLLLSRWLAWNQFRGQSVVQALLALPLVLPPTVLGFYLLTVFAADSSFGGTYASLFGSSLAFSFEGLLIASVIFNIPFAVQPMQRAFEAISRDVRDAAACCGLSRWQQFCSIELPLVWPGVLGAAVLVFAHTIGEFGVVLMVGGNIPGETRTIAIAIYDSVQSFDNNAAAIMSALLLVISLGAIALVFALSGNKRR
ncbi:molybdenum ABC transporter permease subunit [Chromatiales bacterium (ex Bugula neritina AB1)]|nr:molybdenum ABC transporter permease subunit [Chromatiales bacterium (ex Bugula neritina AB1)]